MSKTFDNLAKKAPFFGFSLIKRENFNKHEEEIAAYKEANASTGLSHTLRIQYALRRDGSVKAQGAVFFLSLKNVATYLKEDAVPKFDICKRCLVKMERLNTCEGDPEGIRAGSKCPKCGDIYGCSRSSQFFMRNKHGGPRDWKPAVKGDPVSFVLSSNWLRSAIEFVREHRNDENKVLEFVHMFEKKLNEDAKDMRAIRKSQIKSGEIAG
jgi:hypothetical protein